MRLSTTIAATVSAALATVVVFAVTLSSLAPNSSAQDKADHPKPVYSGDYVKLNGWRKFQLGTAAYVRPELYRSAEVAFTYDAQGLKNNVTPEFIKAIAEGSVWVGVESGDGPLMVSSPSPEQQETWENIVSGKLSEEKLAEWLDAESVRATAENKHLVIVSSYSDLVGFEPLGAYLAWEPKEPIEMRVIEGMGLEGLPPPELNQAPEPKS